VSGPLKGVRVLDLTSVVMGPYAMQVLADLGADVVKVESREGDIMRHGPPMRNPGMGHTFLNTNRNKRSVVLDLKHPQGLGACLALAKTADVLTYNIRPQAMARLGLSYEAVRAVNPRIVYVGAFGYSQRGRYAAKPAYDDLIQALAGIPWLMQASGAEAPRYVPTTYADRTVGLHFSNAVLAALVHVGRTGHGQRVDVPMYESLLQTVLGEHLGGETFRPRVGEPGYSRLISKDRRPYQTRDGWVCVLVYNDKQWKAFFELISQPGLYAADARFTTQAARIANIDYCYAFLAEQLRSRTTDEWLAGFDAHDIPAVRMNTLEDIFTDPHLADIGYFGEVEHPTEGRLTSMAVPSEWSESKPEYRHHAPRLGEHTREVLREAGYDEQAIDALIAQGAARAMEDGK